MYFKILSYNPEGATFRGGRNVKNEKPYNDFNPKLFKILKYAAIVSNIIYKESKYFQHNICFGFSRKDRNSENFN